MTLPYLENEKISAWLREASHLLGAQGASPYRVGAYRNAADSIAHYPGDVRRLFEIQGVKGLDAIPRVGLGIASAVAEMLVTRRWAMLERLRGSTDPSTLFQSVPGIGPAFARRIHDELHIDSLEALEIAAHDGRLAKLRSVGPRRASAVASCLCDMLGRMRQAPSAADSARLPPVELILEIDREYREKAAAGKLRTIAPRRFNVDGGTRLAVLHARREPWHFTALYSNTALAHRLGRVHDWVVVYSYDGDHVERQCTVVTEHRGALSGQRVVRGREDDCLAHYANSPEDHAIQADHVA